VNFTWNETEWKPTFKLITCTSLHKIKQLTKKNETENPYSNWWAELLFATRRLYHKSIATAHSPLIGKQIASRSCYVFHKYMSLLPQMKVRPRLIKEFALLRHCKEQGMGLAVISNGMIERTLKWKVILMVNWACTSVKNDDWDDPKCHLTWFKFETSGLLSVASPCKHLAYPEIARVSTFQLSGNSSELHKGP